MVLRRLCIGIGIVAGQDVEQTPHTPSGQIGGKIRHADVGLVAGIGWVAGISNMITKFYDPEQQLSQF